MFSLFSHLGFPCKSIQLYYFVIVFQEFCISKLLSVFEGGISSAVTGAREGGHWLGGGYNYVCTYIFAGDQYAKAEHRVGNCGFHLHTLI